MTNLNLVDLASRSAKMATPKGKNWVKKEKPAEAKPEHKKELHKPTVRTNRAAVLYDKKR